jgi:Zn-dependent metalloprotease
MTQRSALYQRAAILLLVLGTTFDARAQERQAQTIDPAGLQRLEAQAGGAEQVSLHPGTGTPRFVRLRPGLQTAVAPRAAAADVQLYHQRALSFLTDYAGVYGVSNPQAALQPAGATTDALGATHLTYAQTYQNVPVFAARLRAHFGPDGELTAVSGTTVPNIAVNPVPAIGRDAAAGAALAALRKGTDAGSPAVRGARLYVYRTGLAQGVAGENHLAWEVELGDGVSSRDLIYVDAHTAQILDRVNALHTALSRRVYNNFANFPATPFWVEGDSLPTTSAEANNVIAFSGETYNMFSKAFGRDSFDGAGATMHGIFNASQPGLCPNAFWNGTFTAFCAGVSPDDVVGHEWAHAYTEFTHGLIYAWQPGALNESYSDIFGEIVDFLNGTGSDVPGGARTADTCSVFQPFPPVLVVNTPASIAGTYPAGRAQFGQPLTPAGVTGTIVLADDGAAPSTSDACEPLVNGAAVAGKIALVDRGTCAFVVKVKNAQNAGAIGVVVANAAANGDTIITMAGVDPTITISSVLVGFTTGGLIKGQLAAGVNATMRINQPAVTDNSYRWLTGEDSAAFGGAIRDMWTPSCFGDPGKVSDTQYFCSTGDNGGVHSNSGVPNHGFALLTDGGTYNGHTIGAIGMLKAAHVYYRAMSVYQTPVSDFADHADALEQSCSDLTGQPLVGFDGVQTSESINQSDCDQIATMIEAVELRQPPAQCNFQPLLAKNPPDRCVAGTTQVNIFRDTFEAGVGGWQTSHTTPSATFTPRDWLLVNALPNRNGSAFFGIDPNIGQCSATSDESGVLHLDSPAIALPGGASSPRLTFDHWVATEGGFDGGRLQVSVEGGAWQPVVRDHFTFNPYNAQLVAAPVNTNPLAGQFTFTGSDGGSVEGSWGRSHVDLSPYVSPNQSFRLRFDLGTDGCAGAFGWYVDDVTVYSCTSDTKPTVSINDVAVVEGNHGLTPATFTVSLSQAFARPVKVFYAILPITAWPFLDYIPINFDTLNTAVISPLSLSAEVPVRVIGDRFREADERFGVVIFHVENGKIGDGIGIGTIVNDDGSRHTFTLHSPER